MLVESGTGRRRLYRVGDSYHPQRERAQRPSRTGKNFRSIWRVAGMVRRVEQELSGRSPQDRPWLALYGSGQSFGQTSLPTNTFDVCVRDGNELYLLGYEPVRVLARGAQPVLAAYPTIASQDAGKTRPTVYFGADNGRTAVKPMERGDSAHCKVYETAIIQSASILPFDPGAAWQYSVIRSTDRFVRPPDAIQLACAATAGVDLFVTNDHRLQGKQVTGIQFIVPLENVPI